MKVGLLLEPCFLPSSRRMVSQHETVWGWGSSNLWFCKWSSGPQEAMLSSQEKDQVAFPHFHGICLAGWQQAQISGLLTPNWKDLGTGGNRGGLLCPVGTTSNNNGTLLYRYRSLKLCPNGMGVQGRTLCWTEWTRSPGSLLGEQAVDETPPLGCFARGCCHLPLFLGEITESRPRLRAECG